MLIDTTQEEQGVLVFPPPTFVAGRRALDHLQLQRTSTAWLPWGEFDWLDELRVEWMRLRSRVADSIKEFNDLVAKFKDQDYVHAEALKQAARDGIATPKDQRTSAEARATQRDDSEQRLWANATVMGEHCDKIILQFREREDETLGELKARLEPARQKRVKAERLLIEARAEEFKLYKLGKWVQVTADDGPFGAQPVPKTTDPMPAQVSSDLYKNAFDRHWAEAKPWNSPKVPA